MAAIPLADGLIVRFAVPELDVLRLMEESKVRSLTIETIPSTSLCSDTASGLNFLLDTCLRYKPCMGVEGCDGEPARCLDALLVRAGTGEGTSGASRRLDDGLGCTGVRGGRPAD